MYNKKPLLLTSNNQKPSTKNYLFGFTLVELIVVIVILAILATIAFLSFNSYSSSSRDSVRLSDINSVNKALELFNINASKYPDPSGIYTRVVYSGGVVFEQGNVGDSVLTAIRKVNKKPIDPLDSSEYTYSTNLSRTSFQMKGELENKLSSGFNNSISLLTPIHRQSGLPNLDEELLSSIFPLIRGNTRGLFDTTNADSSTGSRICYVKGNFNGLIEKTNTGNTNYILAVPGLIVNEKNNLNLDYNTLSGKVVCNGMNNPCIVTYTPMTVFVGSGNSVPTSSSDIEVIMNNLKTAYSGSNSTSTNSAISNLLNSSGSELISLGSSVVSKVGVGSVQNITPSIFNLCTSKGQTYTGATYYLGCDTPDKIICNGNGVGQVWAMCNVGATTSVGRNSIPNPTPDNTLQIPTNRVNNVQGSYFQWGRNDDITTTTVVSSLAPLGTLANGVGHNNFIKAPTDWIDTKNDNLWGGAKTTYTGGVFSEQSMEDQLLMRGPCADGYHVPTMKEWCDLVVSIGGGATCIEEYQSFTSTASTLKLSLAGRRNYNTGNYYRQNTYGHYWASSPNGINARYLLISSSQIFPLNGYNRTFGFSVRCLKN